MRLLDRFDDITAWHASASDEVKASIRRVGGPGAKGRRNGAPLSEKSPGGGNALCLDFDFGGVSGYAAVRRRLPLTYGPNYEFSLDLRGDAAPNTLQFKLIDASGENVWWVERPDYTFPRQWQQLRFKKRHISFAWGPSKDHELQKSAAIELVVARGRGGGKGSVCFSNLSFRELPVPAEAAPSPAASASSSLPPTQPSQAVDGAMDTAWSSDPGAGPEQTLTVDFGQPREFGGLVLHWLPLQFASRYDIDLSDDGKHWRTVRHVRDGDGGADPHRLPESEARFVRLRLHDGPTKAYGLAEIEVKGPAFGESPNAFIQAVAKQAPRGLYPRSFSGEQSYWTVLGIDGGGADGLLSEDGAFDVGARSGSVEPFLLYDDKLVTWADVEVKQSLLDGYLPIPSVAWSRGDLALHVTAFASGHRTKSQVNSRYTVENLSDQPRSVTLALAVRPFQVNPPTQFLNTPGGVSLIHDLAWDGSALAINGEQRLFPLTRPDRIVLADFDAGDIARLCGVPSALQDERQAAAERPLASLPQAESDDPLPGAPAAASPRAASTKTASATDAPAAIHDETGFATAVFLYHLELPPHGRRDIEIVAPLAGVPELTASDPGSWWTARMDEVAATWRQELNRVALHVPAADQRIADTLRTALAHILIERNGPALQPGVRAYARTWIRDGAMMSDALLRLDHADVARQFADWFAPYQFASGKVPCCVDSRGADPVVENDSAGELIYLIDQQYRYSHDRSWLQGLWPRVAAAATYMDSLRAKERTAENTKGRRRAFYGLMPASISHEGYSDRPAYSYWDDFWALAGYDSAVEIARALGREGDVKRFVSHRDQFKQDLYASIKRSIADHAIDYLPASADRADYDPNSTTIALSVAGVQADLPQDALRQTFEHYWKEAVERFDGRKDWGAYTPYELRNVGAFVRLGWRERSEQLLDFFLSSRRPASWNQWAEVVIRERRRPHFIGDLPHAWVASDFIQSTLDLFAYERRADHALVIAAGLPTKWLAGQGVGIEHLKTAYGDLSYTVRQDDRQLVLTIAEGLHVPPGGVVFTWPYGEAPGAARINGLPLRWEKDRQLRIRELPAVVTVATGR